MERVIYRNNDERLHQIQDFSNPTDDILDEQVFEIDKQLKAGQALDADFSETMKCFSFSLQKNESDTTNLGDNKGMTLGQGGNLPLAKVKSQAAEPVTKMNRKSDETPSSGVNDSIN